MEGRIVVAFSGGERSAQALLSLCRSFAEVVAVVVDVGQERTLAGVRQQALALGAMRVHVIDARDDFLDRHVLPALQLGALADVFSAADPALLHPLIARSAAEIAAMEDAVMIAHGAPADGPVAARLQRLIGDCGFHGPVHAALERTNARVPAAAGIVTGWARSRRGTGTVPRSDDRAAYLLTRDPARPAGSASVAITFVQGRPTAVNGVSLSLAESFEVITTIAGDHGIGRVASIDPAGDGWTIAEAPAAVVISAAFTALCTAVAGADAVAARSALTPSYRVLLDAGRWHAPVRDAIDAFLASIAARASGVTHLDLRHGECHVGRIDIDVPQPATPVAPHVTY